MPGSHLLECSVLHHGIPVGRVGLTRNELAVGELRPEPGYVGIRGLICRASESLWSIGFLADPRLLDTSNIPLDVLTQAAELQLELRNTAGAPILTDFVNIVERPDPNVSPVVFARFRLTPAGEVAGTPVTRSSGSVATHSTP